MSNTEELKYIKVPLFEGDFTEENIKYTIPAKEFFRLISTLQETVDENFESTTDEIQSLTKVYNKIEERLSEIEHILRRIKENK